MKKKILIMVLGLSIIITIFSGIKINQAYSHTPTIYYDGQKKEFTYLNAENKDFFINLKEIMPGDIREQEILFKAENIRNDTKVFLNISKKIDDELLKYIKIYVDNKEMIKDEEYVQIGEFSKDKEIKLKVIVKIPTEVGNEIQDLKYNIDWEMLIQEDGGELLEIPYTYDDSNIILYFIICIISIFGIIYTTSILSRKEKR